MDIYERIVEIQRRGDRAALATVVGVQGSSPGKPAFKLLVTESGNTFGSVGGGCMEADVIEAAKEVIASEEARLLEFTLTEKATGDEGLICGGKAQVYIEPIVSPHVVLMGSGHVAKAIAEVAALAGFGIVVLDDRPEYLTEERFPAAARRVIAPFEDALDRIPVNRSSYIAIVTRNHSADEVCLRQALRTKAGYIGMIGSKTKVRKIFGRLVEEGVPEADLERVHAPIGIEIEAETSEEIAVSVVAQMIRIRRTGRLR